MYSMRRALLIVLAIAGAGCAGTDTTPGPQPLPTASPAVVLMANPTSYIFGINETTPKAIAVTRNYSTFSSLAATPSDPTRVGVSVSTSGGTAIVSVLPIASGPLANILTITDGSSGASTTVGLSTAPCGRPENLDHRSQLVWPLPGATGVTPNIGTVYFAIFTPTTLILTTKLHMVVGTNATLEGGTLQTATPPGGAVAPTPPPGMVETYMNASVPTLPSGTAIHTQIYDDTCQGALLTGTFST